MEELPSTGFYFASCDSRGGGNLVSSDECRWVPACAGTVRPSGGHISAVKVRVGVGHSPVAESNCVAVRRGGEQLEANWRSVV